MSHIVKLRELCNKLISQEYGLIEFQERLETAIFPEIVESVKLEVLNELEEIRFTKLEANYYTNAKLVAERLLEKLE